MQVDLGTCLTFSLSRIVCYIPHILFYMSSLVRETLVQYVTAYCRYSDLKFLILCSTLFCCLHRLY